MSTFTIRVFEQRPADVEIIEVDYDRLYLGPLGDTATELLAVEHDAGITVITSPPVGAISNGVIKMAVSGVTAGTTYQVITIVKSAAGRIREHEFQVLGVVGGIT